MPAAQTIEQFKLRLPSNLKDRLGESAAIHRRSVNAEIIVLLERALPPEKEKADVAATTSTS